MSTKPVSATELPQLVEPGPGAGFKIPKWLMGGSAGTGIGALLLGAITWANSVATTMARIETKVDDMKERVRRLEDHQFTGPQPKRRERDQDSGRDDG